MASFPAATYRTTIWQSWNQLLWRITQAYANCKWVGWTADSTVLPSGSEATNHNESSRPVCLCPSRWHPCRLSAVWGHALHSYTPVLSEASRPWGPLCPTVWLVCTIVRTARINHQIESVRFSTHTLDTQCVQWQRPTCIHNAQRTFLNAQCKFLNAQCAFFNAQRAFTTPKAHFPTDIQRAFPMAQLPTHISQHPTLILNTCTAWHCMSTSDSSMPSAAFAMHPKLQAVLKYSSVNPSLRLDTWPLLWKLCWPYMNVLGVVIACS